ncbi:MAG: glutaredoxin family protein [Promethearchaeota archaeon]
MSVEKLFNKFAINVEGEHDKREITIFTLSTCMWCKKCKRWLNERNIKYRYVDVDKIDHSDKRQIINYLGEKFQSRISYPFMICDDKELVVGYDPSRYEELMKGGDDE